MSPDPSLARQASGARAPTLHSPAGLAACIALAIVVSLLFNSWVTDPRNFFYADDWAWLGRAEFWPRNWLSDLWPGYIYNSRPIGEALVTGIYAVSGMDHVAYHRIWLAIHCLNVVLLLLLLWPLLPPVRATLAALAAACWWVTLVAVSWVGAVFDLLSATWCLGALLLYRQSARGGSAGIAAALGAALLFALAVRTKELAIALAAVIVAYEFLFMPRAAPGVRLRRLLPTLIVFVVLGLRYAWLYRQMPALPADDPYNASVSPASIAANLGYYLQQLTYSTGMWSAAAFVALGAYGLVARNRVVLFGLLGFVALMSAVLILPSQRAPLYLYVPHFFLAAALLAVFPRSRVATVLAVALVALLVWWPVRTTQMAAERGYMLSVGEYSRQLLADYLRLPPAPAEFIRVDRPYFSPFQYGARAPAQAADSVPPQATAVNIVRHDDKVLVVVDEKMEPLLQAFCAYPTPGARLLDEVQLRLVDRTAWARAQCVTAPG